MIFGERYIANKAQRRDDFSPGHDGGAGRTEVLLGACERSSGDALHGAVLGRNVEARDRRSEAFLEISAAQFSVGDHRKPDRRLPANDERIASSLARSGSASEAEPCL